MGRALVGDRAEPDALARVAHARCQPGQGGEVAGGGEAGDVTDLGDDEQGDEDADAGDVGEDGDARVVLGARLDLPLDCLRARGRSRR